jgi:hypothetical protein
MCIKMIYIFPFSKRNQGMELWNWDNRHLAMKLFQINFKKRNQIMRLCLDWLLFTGNPQLKEPWKQLDWWKLSRLFSSLSMYTIYRRLLLQRDWPLHPRRSSCILCLRDICLIISLYNCRNWNETTLLSFLLCLL